MGHLAVQEEVLLRGTHSFIKSELRRLESHLFPGTRKLPLQKCIKRLQGIGILTPRFAYLIEGILRATPEKVVRRNRKAREKFFKMLPMCSIVLASVPSERVTAY